MTDKLREVLSKYKTLTDYNGMIDRDILQSFISDIYIAGRDDRSAEINVSIEQLKEKLK